MSNHDSAGLSKLERLAALLHDDGVEPESMSPQQLDVFLKASKADMAEPQRRFDYLLKRARARRKLELARGSRLKAAERANSILTSSATALAEVRAKVAGMIEKLKQRDPDQALVYAREFEKATPEDYATLQEDLMLLELEGEENGSGNK